MWDRGTVRAGGDKAWRSRRQARGRRRGLVFAAAGRAGGDEAWRRGAGRAATWAGIARGRSGRAMRGRPAAAQAAATEAQLLKRSADVA